MGKLFLTLLASAALAVPAATPAAPAHRAAHPRGVDDPRAFVAQRFAGYRSGSDHVPPDPIWAYSPRLNALFATYNSWQRRHPDEVGSIDFDWWISAQDWELSGVSVAAADNGPDARIVTASWHNSGSADSSRFLFVRSGGRWYLDDVVHGAGHGDDGWTLSALLGNPAQ